MSNIRNNLSDIITIDSLPTTIAEDLGMLLKKLRIYRDSLNEKERQEFEYAWGREEDDDYNNNIIQNKNKEKNENNENEEEEENNSIILNKNIISRIFESMKEIILPRNKSSSENILMELGNVRKIVCREASYFTNPMIDEESKKKRLNLLFVKDLLDGVIVCREASYFTNPMIDEESKKKRLNLLFVKDLLDGVNGMILDHKDRRDNEIKNQVELWKKVLGW
eukprot:CAMPEP_0174825728 /NCGR_PEP_ID=MMETSP1107-20130205/43041_1 /TAXON_ID=36770 /ORGANISM="Paraphysomonas vestita, Strain GFlagA" /LENGTH=222 /DNA_ID=CAMNT_0016057629 /DNA_START=1189 /DNA_END=1854 /DNA_ORIENTATION=+